MPFVAIPLVVIALGGTGVFSLTVDGMTLRGTPAEFIVWPLSVTTPVALVAPAYQLSLDYARTRLAGGEIDQRIA